MPEHRARLHHLVPEFYLRRFAGDDGSVLVTDKIAGTRKLIAPRVLMTQHDYYTLETVDGLSDEVERWLSQLEGDAADVLRRIDAGHFPPTRADRDMLSMFMAFQLCRGPQFHETLETAASMQTEAMALGLSTFPEAMRQAIRETLGNEPSDEEIREHQDDLRRAVDEKRITTTVPRPMAVIEMMAIAPELARFLAQRSFDLYETGEPSFIAGDVPVAMWNRPLFDGRPMPVGVMTAQEITFPIDSRRCILLGQPGTGEGHYAIPSDSEGGLGVQHLNERHYLYARRFTFQHPGSSFTFDRDAALER